MFSCNKMFVMDKLIVKNSHINNFCGSENGMNKFVNVRYENEKIYSIFFNAFSGNTVC